MADKNEAEVVINGKVIRLSGCGSTGYLEKVASYLNGKIGDMKKSESFKKQTTEMQNLMIQLNIVDDYFKARKVADTLNGDLEGKDKEIYDLKHELVALQIKYDSLEGENEQLKKDLSEYQKKIITMGTSDNQQ